MKKIPSIQWDGAGWDVRLVAAKDKQAFVDAAKDARGKASRAALHDKCTALVAEADAPEVESPATTAKGKAKKATEVTA